MNPVMLKPIIKSGQVYTVYCQKSGAMTLLVNCEGCEFNRGYDWVLRLMRCEQR